MIFLDAYTRSVFNDKSVDDTKCGEFLNCKCRSSAEHCFDYALCFYYVCLFCICILCLLMFWLKASEEVKVSDWTSR